MSKVASGYAPEPRNSQRNTLSPGSCQTQTPAGWCATTRLGATKGLIRPTPIPPHRVLRVPGDAAHYSSLMIVVLAVLVACGVVGAALVLVGPAHPESTGKGARVQRLFYVVGVSLLSTFTVLVMAGIISWALLDQVGDAIGDSFSDSNESSEYEDFGDYEGYEDGPEIAEDGQILPETEEEWEMFCSPDSGASEENRELYCF